MMLDDKDNSTASCRFHVRVRVGETLDALVSQGKYEKFWDETKKEYKYLVKPEGYNTNGIE